jgi:outer membrane PBP1 activator LpoA protein
MSHAAGESNDMQAPNLHRLRSILPWLLLCCLFDAHATTSTTALTQANQSRLSNEAEQLASQGRHSDAAARFETLAMQADATQRSHWLLKAARSAQLAGNDAKAQSLLDITGKTLNSSDSALQLLVSAALATQANQAERAITLLDQVPLPMPAELASDLLATRIAALFATGLTVLAVNTAQDRERVLSSAADINQNRQQLWNGLKQALTTGQDLTPPVGASRVTAGWLELAKLVNTSQRDPFGYTRALNDWRTRYPNHPGSDMLVSSTAPQAIGRTGAQRIALLLPLTGRQQAAGIAIRDGVLAAALQLGSGNRNSIEIFDTNAGVLDAYGRALQAGANLVIGPLLKADVETLASSQQVSVTTLALNVLSETQLPPGLMFQFALDPEDEARQVAQRALDEGHSHAIVLAPNNDWGQRVQRAFADELRTRGGTLVDSRSYDPNAND